MVIVVLIIIILVASLGKSTKQVTSDHIKIGFIGPLTGFGASWGEESKVAVDLAVKEINKAGGIGGQPVDIIYEDGKCGSKDAVTAAQKLISVDQVKVIFTVCGQESMSVAPIAEQNKVLMMALWSTPPKLSGIGQYVFRNSYSDDDTGRIMAEFINKKFNKVAILSEETDYSIGLRDAFKKHFKGQVIDETYLTGIKDARTLALKITSQHPQAIILNPSAPADGLAALSQIKQLGFDGPLYGNYFGGVTDVLASKYSEGMIFFTDPDVANNVQRDQLFSLFQTTTGHKANFDFAVAISYDSVYIMKQAIEKVGLEPTRLKDYLHSLKDFSGVMGVYGFKDNGDATGYSPSMKQIQNGKVVSL